jgi:hypothetical protein
MKVKASKIIFNEAKFSRDVVRIMKKALDKAGKKFVKELKANISRIPKSGKGATGDPQWHTEVKELLRTRFDKFSDGVITQLAGLVDLTDTFMLIKAKLLEYGGGSGADTSGGGSGYPIEHVQNVPGLNDSITGYAKPSDRKNYLLPPGFNQGPQYWYRDLEAFFDVEFYDIIEEAWKEINPWDYIIMK